MINKKIKLLIMTIICIISIFIFANKVEAASATITANNNTVTVGTNVVVTIKYTAAAWNLLVDGGGLTTFDSTAFAYQTKDAKNGTDTEKITFKTSKAGTYTIKMTGTVTDQDKTKVTINKSITVTVKDKETTPTPTFTSVNETVYATEEVNIRKSYSTSSSIIGTLDKDKSITRTGIGDNGWSKVSYNGSTGYINSSYLTTKKPSDNNKPNDKPNFTSVNETVYVIEEVNVRKSYSLDSQLLGTLKKGDNLTRTGIGDNDWSKVIYNNSTAYIKTSYLSKTKPTDEKSSNKNLSSLKVTPTGLTPKFDKETTAYTMTVGTDIKEVKIEAIAEDSKSKVSVTGNQNLIQGENVIKIKVTAEDETTRTYIITVTKETKQQVKLSTLEIQGITLNPLFDPDIYEYTLNIEDNTITELVINSMANNDKATIEIVGNKDLKDGENIITILVKPDEETENIVSYQIKVNKIAKVIQDHNELDPKMQLGLYIIAGIIALIILIAIINSVIKRRRNYEDDEFEEDIDTDEKEETRKNKTGLDMEDEKTDDIDRPKEVENIEKEPSYNVGLLGVEEVKKSKRGKHF